MGIFVNYSDLANKYYKNNICILLEHTLISANIIKTQLFDREQAKTNLKDLYGHMHGILNNIFYGNNKILILKYGLIVREVRAEFHDTFAYAIIPKKHWIYINWVISRLKLNKFVVLKQIFGWKKLLLNGFIPQNVYFYKDDKYKYLSLLGITIKIKRTSYKKVARKK